MRAPKSKGVAMAKPVKAAGKAVRAKPKSTPPKPGKPEAVTAAEASPSAEPVHPGRKLAGVVVGIVAQRLLIAGVKRLVRRLR
ncbi:hypothetical protein [Sphingopyxis indica]|uniref:Uncharacterized protein n=1 Tax=Sphingopyxis indica TaxID=436663 RepID=A0A239EFG0_9SPHN|nr:hypothetical protein [Sphingopyxis indica]SNS43357.1 hypothetical protein SAMN06295955_101747 [Sphingopyxis indica]